MNAKVMVSSENKFGEIEWEEIFTSESLQGAKSKATRWLNRNVFYNASELAKEDFNEYVSYWRLR